MVQLLLIGCSKESDTAAPQPQKALRQSAAAYDYLGEQHNAGLDFFLRNADPKDARSQAEPLTIKFVESQGYNGEEAAHTFADPQFKEITTSSAPDEALRKYYEANGMKQELAYFNQFTKVLSTSSTPDEAAERLGELQETVAADNTLSDDSQANLLKGITVGKYSARYWYAQSLLGDKNPWTTTFGNNALKPWWGYAVADAIGFFEGGIWGSIFGSILYGLP